MFAWFPQPSACRRKLRQAATLLGAFLMISAGLAQAGPVTTANKITLEGTLEVLHEDRPEGGRYHYFLQSGGRRFQLRLKDQDDRHGHSHDRQTGDRVRVRGQQIGETLALDGAGSSMETLSYVLPNTFGPQKTLVLLVNFQDNPSQPYTTAYAED